MHPKRPSSLRALVIAVVLLLAALVGRDSSAAAALRDPMAEVKATVDHVLAILNDPAYKTGSEARRQKLREAIAGHFDFPAMARSSLGYHWKELSQADRDRFVPVFTRFVEASYIGKIESYSGQKINFIKEITTDSDYAQVNSNIVQEGKEPIGINYQLKQTPEGWKVYDVVVDQISIVSNYRTQFNRVINNRGFNALVQDMAKKQQQIEASK